MFALIKAIRRARCAGLEIAWTEAIAMWLRKSRPTRVLNAAAMAAEAGVAYPIDRAEAASIVGTDPMEIATAAIMLKRRGEEPDLDILTACDLAGYRILMLVEHRIDYQKVVGGPNPPGPNYRKPSPHGL